MELKNGDIVKFALTESCHLTLDFPHENKIRTGMVMASKHNDKMCIIELYHNATEYFSMDEVAIEEIIGNVFTWNETPR